MSTEPVSARKRGRPPAENPRDKLARLEKEIAAVRALVREAELRKFTVLGEAVAAEAAENPELRATVRDILTRRVTAPQAKADVAPFLAD